MYPRRKRSGNYRSKHINYRKPGLFLITFTKRDFIPDFSRIINNPKEPDILKCCRSDYYPLGYVIFNQIKNFKEINEDIKIRQYVIMPDHVHILLEIIKILEKPLGKYLAIFKRKCFVTANSKNILKPGAVKSLFKSGFNDQYFTHKRSLDEIYRYIKKNPYWNWVRKENPDFFKNIPDMVIAGFECSIYGNLALLDNPFKYPVVVHRADLRDPKILKDKFEYLEYGLFNGGVLVGAFVNKAEKEILKMALEKEGKVIWIKTHSYGKREKPGDKLLSLCKKGNLLIISPKFDRYLPANREFRQECLLMNTLAERLGSIAEQ